MFGLGDKLFSLEEWNRSRQAWKKVMENLKYLRVAGEKVMENVQSLLLSHQAKLLLSFEDQLLRLEEWNGSRQVQMKVMENLQNLRPTVRHKRKFVETYRSTYPAIRKISFLKVRVPSLRRIRFQYRGKR